MIGDNMPCAQTDLSSSMPAGCEAGLGLRPAYLSSLLEPDDMLQRQLASLGWLEVITDDYLLPGGSIKDSLYAIAERYPIVMHSVAMSLAGTDPLDQSYIKSIATLADQVQPRWVSDHLCWSNAHGRHSHDLLPFPFNNKTLQHISDRVLEVQNILGRPLVIENATRYLEFKSSTMPEYAFLQALCDRTGCRLLIDINNLYVNAHNHAYDPIAYLQALPAAQVQQYHLAGLTIAADEPSCQVSTTTNIDASTANIDASTANIDASTANIDASTILLDTHDAPVSEPVWDLYQRALQIIGVRATCIERDDHLPPLPELLQEVARVDHLIKQHLVVDVGMDKV